MLLFQQTLPIDSEIFTFFSENTKDVLFFDIETTGFSASSSYVYLIGCVDCATGEPTLHQWFLNDISEEKLLVQTFLKYASDFTKLVHYNGTTFDIPYIQKKCKRHRLVFSLDTLESIDLYRQLSPLRNLFRLPDMKQKTVERFLGLHRDDPFSGGDLIPVYTEYLAKVRLEALRGTCMTPVSLDFSDTGLPQMTTSPSKALLSTLLLHNHEDLTGLCRIAGLLSLPAFFCGNFEVKASRETLDAPTTCTLLLLYNNKSLSPKTALLPTTTARALATRPLLQKPLPENHELVLQLLPDGTGMRLTVPLYYTTLKYFFDNYKEYYYLPMEDQAMHKSVAEFVDPAFRTKATRDNCYQKKTDVFLFQPTSEQAPAFRFHYKDKFSFFTPTNAFWQSAEELKRYAVQLLTWMLGK